MNSNRSLPRRDLLKQTVALSAAILANRNLRAADDPAKPALDRRFSISLAQWSLHKQFKKGEIDPIDFPVVASKDFSIRAVEYVNQFYFEKIKEADFFRKLRQRADDHGVKNLLIMCDMEGELGDADENARKEAVRNHHRWADAAATLGCHSIRVNAIGDGDPEEVKKRCAESLHELADYTGKLGLNTIVENHGGYSSRGEWVEGLMKLADHPRVGTLPDFGNFRLPDGTFADRYDGVRRMMPFAKAVSAKSHEFDDKGNEVRTDYVKMMEIVLAAGYHEYVGIEYEGEKHSPAEGIQLTKALLERIRTGA